MHFLGGGVALLVGWSQFWSKLRNRNIKIHRFLGYVYVISALSSGVPGGIYLALHANGGFTNALGFGMLGIFWFFTTTKAFIHIRKVNIDKHQEWMIRSYALCLAAVSLRLWMPLFIFGFSIDPEQAYQAMGWFCWVPNLIIAEWLIHQNLVAR